MIDAVIVSTARTGFAKSWKGALNMTYGPTLAGHAVRAAVERSGLDPAEIEDVVLGARYGGSCDLMRHRFVIVRQRAAGAQIIREHKRSDGGDFERQYADDQQAAD